LLGEITCSVDFFGQVENTDKKTDGKYKKKKEDSIEENLLFRQRAPSA
jgi:hypothetical protein